MTSEAVRHDLYQPYTEMQIAQVKEYIAHIDDHHSSLWDIPDGDELTWEMHISPELVILYSEGVEEYNPWYEAWGQPGESPFGPAVTPLLLLPYFQNWFHRQSRNTTEVGAMATSWRTKFIAPCPVGTTVRYRGKLGAKYVKRGRQTVERDFTIEDAKTGQVYAVHTAIAVAKYKQVEEGSAAPAPQHSDLGTDNVEPPSLKYATGKPPIPAVKAVVTKGTPVGFEIEGVKKQIPIQIMGSRMWGRLNPIHFDPVVAAKHGLPAPIATGMMSSAYIAETCVNFFGTWVFQNATMEGKYIRPTFPNEIITTRGVVRSKTPEGNGFRFAVEVWAENEAGEKKTVTTVTALVE